MSAAQSQPRPYTRAASLPKLLRDRILILDGAMGTMIQRYKLTKPTIAARASPTIGST
jgi:5-methyltetrahydrofolate--homocysteine methyltransferase